MPTVTLDRTKNPLYKWRQKHGLSRREVRESLGLLSNTTIYNWELGKTTPDEFWIQQVANLLGVRPQTIQRSWKRWRDG